MSGGVDEIIDLSLPAFADGWDAGVKQGDLAGPYASHPPAGEGVKSLHPSHRRRQHLFISLHADHPTQGAYWRSWHSPSRCWFNRSWGLDRKPGAIASMRLLLFL